jgi:DNA-binding CsgD family transcriptional regulator
MTGVREVAERGTGTGEVCAAPGVRRCRSWPQPAAALAQHVTREILALVPAGPDRLSTAQPVRSAYIAALARGVPVRLVHDAAAVGCSAATVEIRALVAAGAQVRLVDRIPQALLIFDRSVALLVTGPRAGTDLLLWEPSVVASMCTVFGDAWRRAERNVATDATGGMIDDVRDRAVLQLMSQGVPDVSAARSMGISPRTYGRWVAELMARLGATSRFQAGVLAAAGGWLGERHDRGVRPGAAR